MSTENTSPNLAQAEKIVAAAMAEAKQKLAAVAVSPNSPNLSFDGEQYYAAIGACSYAFNPSLSDAVDRAIAAYGTPESRREKEIAEIRAKAEKLGLRVVESEVAA